MADVIFNEREFELAIVEQARQEVRIALARIAPRIRLEAQEAVETAVRASPEHTSLLAGELQRLFGIENPEPAVNNIIAGIRNSVQVTQTPGVGAILGGIRLEILRTDMTDVLGVEGSSYISRSVVRHTEILVPWLEWLLLAGDKIVVTDFEVHTERGGYTGSRSGRAIMVHPTRRASRGFRIPAEFSGVIDDNWLTRCLEQLVGPVEVIFLRALESL